MIVKLDGANGLLFHVEQTSEQTRWEYQARWPESRVVVLREWQAAVVVDGFHALVPLGDPTVAAEVRWRWVSQDGADGVEWQMVAGREWESVTALFLVRMREDRDFSEDPEVLAGAMVGGNPAGFRLVMPRRRVLAGEVVEVPGEALHFGIGNVLRAAGEFEVSGPAFAVSNAGPGQVTLREAASLVPSVLPYIGTFAVKAGRLSEDELAAFRDYLERNPQSVNGNA